MIYTGSTPVLPFKSNKLTERQNAVGQVRWMFTKPLKLTKKYI